MKNGTGKKRNLVINDGRKGIEIEMLNFAGNGK